MNDPEAPKAASVAFRADTVHLIDHVQPNKQQSCVINFVTTVAKDYTQASALCFNKCFPATRVLKPSCKSYFWGVEGTAGKGAA